MLRLSLTVTLISCLYQPYSYAVTPCRVDGKIIYTRECLKRETQASEEVHRLQQNAIDQSRQLLKDAKKTAATPTNKPVPLPSQRPASAASNIPCDMPRLFEAVIRNQTDVLTSCSNTEQLGKSVNSAGRTVLHEAAATGNIEAVGYLLSINVPLNPQSRGDRGATPLHLAALREQPRVIRMLHEAGADLEARDYLKRTPLHLASGNGAAAAVRLLIRLRANVNSTDRANRTPLLVASQQPNSKELLKSLLDAGADINHATNRATTALHYAVVTDTESTELLLSQGIALDNRNHLGQTPLLYAVHEDTDKHWARIKLVVEAGANLNATTADQDTLLKIAYRQQHEPLLNLLLKHGVDTRNVASFIESYRESQSNL